MVSSVTELGEAYQKRVCTFALSSKFLQQRLGILHIGDVKALGEPAVDGASSSRASVRWPCCRQSRGRRIATRSSRDVAC
jgi:hypothetical protein